MKQILSFPSSLFSFIRSARNRRLRRQILQVFVIVVLFGSALTQIPVTAVGASPLLATITVNTTADEAGTGAGCSLREAITAANTNLAFGGCLAGSPGADTINLPAGTYTLSIANAGGVNEDDNATGDLDILESLTIQGAGSGSTIIGAGTTNANGIDKVIAANPFCTAGVNVTIDGVTVSNGRNTQTFGLPDFSYTGAGIDWCAGGAGETFTLSNAVIADNTNVHGYGGGLNIDSLPGASTVNITNVTFQNNTISNDATTFQGTGAGINIFTDQSTVTITNSTFTGNQALRTNAGGGAIAYRPTSTSSLQISGSTFSNNSAQGSGGAVYISALTAGTTFSLQNSQFTNNTATTSFGGGLYLGSVPLNTNAYPLTNLAITGNHAGIAGGGLYMGPANVTMTNSRIVNNTATSGSGLFKSVDPGTAMVANNWWGCSTGPSAIPCDQASTAGGTLNFTPWFRDQLTSASAPLVTNQSSVLTASFLTNSTGGAVPLANLTQLINQPVTWAATLGSLSGPQTTVQASGTATATFTASGAGSAVISAKVDNDNTSVASSNVLNLTVNKAATTTVIGTHTPDPSVTGQVVVVSATVTGQAGNSPTAPTGTITVSSGINACTITLPASSCNLTITTAGPKTISALYNGDANFNASPASASVAHTVNKADTTTSLVSLPNPSTFLESVTFTATVAPAPTGGTVNFLDNGTTFGGCGTAAVNTTTGVATCTTTALAAGTHANLTAVYSGDANYNGSTSSPAYSHTVNMVNTTTGLASLPNPSTFQQSVTFSATILPVPTGGTVNFLDNGTTFGGCGTMAVNTTNGLATCTTTALAIGTHANMTAVFSGDVNYNASTSNIYSHAVSQATTTTSLASLPNPSNYLQSVVFTATVSPAPSGGTVNFLDNGTTFGGCGAVVVDTTSGLATCTTTTLATATHANMTAVYTGDSNFNGSTSTVYSHTVNKAATSAGLASLPNPSTYLQSVTFTTTILPVPTGGTVNFLDNGTTFGGCGAAAVNTTSGLATCTTTALATGVHANVTAVFSGDTNFNGSTTNTAYSHTVDKASITTGLGSSGTPSLPGQLVTFTATVTPSPTGGTVDFLDGATPLCSTVLLSGASASCPTSTLTAGTHSVTAVYSGDSNYLTSTSNVFDQVVSLNASSTSLVSSKTPTVYGESVTFTATVTPTAATGTVTFQDGGLDIAGCTGQTLTIGIATCSVSTLNAAIHSITAVYSGDILYATSTSFAFSQTVGKAVTVVSINTDLSAPSVYKQTISVSATVSVTGFGGGSPTGNVTIGDGVNSCTAAVTAGTATCNLTFNTVGQKMVTASFTNVDGNYLNSVSAPVYHLVYALRLLPYMVK